jgi:hypothetical protein
MFSLFHFYFFSRPFGFSYLALWTTFLFLFHAMVHFFYRYEIPAVINGSVRVDMPRMSSQSSGSAIAMTSVTLPYATTPTAAAAYEWFANNNIAATSTNPSNFSTPSGGIAASAAALLSSITLAAQRDYSENSIAREPAYAATFIGNRSRTASNESTASSVSSATATRRPRDLVINTSSPSQQQSTNEVTQEQDPSLVSINSFRGLYTPERRHKPRRRSLSQGQTVHIPSNQSIDDQLSHSGSQPNSSRLEESPGTAAATSSSSTHEQQRRGFYQQSENGSIPVLGAILGANLSPNDDSPRYFSTVNSYASLSIIGGGNASSREVSRPSSTRNSITNTLSSSRLNTMSSDDIDIREQRSSDDRFPPYYAL